MKLLISLLGLIMLTSIHAQDFGTTVSGNFGGRRTTATAVRASKGRGNPIENGVPDKYEVRFSDKNLGKIQIGCCEAWLLNEKDLNGDGLDEISIYQAPMNGCTYEMRTFSFKGRIWRKVVPTFLIPTGCDGVTQNDLKNRIFSERQVIYYLKTDPNNFSKLIRVRVD